MGRPSDGMTSEEVREEYDWIYEFQSRMAKHICEDADIHNLVDYVGKLEDENAKLRELVLDMWCALWECNQYTCKHGEEGCYTKNGDNGGKCVLRDRMRELGVEVNA